MIQADIGLIEALHSGSRGYWTMDTFYKPTKQTNKQTHTTQKHIGGNNNA